MENFTDDKGNSEGVKRFSHAYAESWYVFVVQRVHGNHWEGFDRVRDNSEVSTNGSVVTTTPVQQLHDPVSAIVSKLPSFVAEHTAANHSSQNHHEL